MDAFFSKQQICILIWQERGKFSDSEMIWKRRLLDWLDILLHFASLKIYIIIDPSSNEVKASIKKKILGSNEVKMRIFYCFKEIRPMENNLLKSLTHLNYTLHLLSYFGIISYIIFIHHKWIYQVYLPKKIVEDENFLNYSWFDERSNAIALSIT